MMKSIAMSLFLVVFSSSPLWAQSLVGSNGSGHAFHAASSSDVGIADDGYSIYNSDTSHVRNVVAVLPVDQLYSSIPVVTVYLQQSNPNSSTVCYYRVTNSLGILSESTTMTPLHFLGYTSLSLPRPVGVPQSGGFGVGEFFSIYCSLPASYGGGTTKIFGYTSTAAAGTPTNATVSHAAFHPAFGADAAFLTDDGDSLQSTDTVSSHSVVADLGLTINGAPSVQVNVNIHDASQPISCLLMVTTTTGQMNYTSSYSSGTGAQTLNLSLRGAQNVYSGWTVDCNFSPLGTGAASQIYGMTMRSP
jgi:hypothetical protein